MMETLRQIWAWWRDRLLECLPGQGERARHRLTDGFVITALDAGGLDPVARVVPRRHGQDLAPRQMTLDQAGVEGLQAEATRARLPIVVRLPTDLLLEREIALPLAAERGLAQVVFHEMDRFTPFAASEVIWHCVPISRDRAQGKLLARLSLVPRAAVSGVLDTLAQAGLRAQALELATRQAGAEAGAEAGGESGAESGGVRRIPLAGATGFRHDLRRHAPVLSGFAALALLALASPFFWQSLAFSEVDARIAAKRPAVETVQRLRAAMAAGATGAEAVAAERHRTGDALEAIAQLTDAIPDDTYLTGLTYDTGTLSIDGQSKSAAALIGPLTANAHFEDANFTAPVVRNALGRDSFSLKLKVAR